MIRNIIFIVCPFFLPSILLALIVFLIMLASPYKEVDGYGPAGSDVMGVYGMMAAFVLGGCGQLGFGLPLNALLLRLNHPASRFAVVFIGALAPALPLLILILKTPAGTFWEIFSGISVVCLVYACGGYLCWRFIRKDTLAGPRSTPGESELGNA